VGRAEWWLTRLRLASGLVLRRALVVILRPKGCDPSVEEQRVTEWAVEFQQRGCRVPFRVRPDKGSLTSVWLVTALACSVASQMACDRQWGSPEAPRRSFRTFAAVRCAWPRSALTRYARRCVFAETVIQRSRETRGPTRPLRSRSAPVPLYSSSTND
jgi:hypothetical protein